MGNLTKDAMLALLKTYEESYYSGESIATDEQYDNLKDMYVKEYGEYDFVPNEGDTHFEKTKHLSPLKSLDKYQIKDEEGIKKELKRLWPVVIQPKFDGLSIEIQFVNDKLKFVTRGNGEIGDDVTAQCMQIPGVEILKNLFYITTTSFRAEILMTHSDFQALNKIKEQDGEDLLSNCRNAASGMLRNKDLSKVKGLTIMLYEDLGSDYAESYDISSMHDYITEELELDNDYAHHIRITPCYTPNDIETAYKYLKELEAQRKMIDYDIDGWVVKCNLPHSLKLHGGYTGHHPKNAFAVKGEAKGEWTTIKSITWQVGKESITPVAELEPVEIDGSIISRATLHNVSFLKAIGLNTLDYKDKYRTKPLTKIKVVKANDVIPKITEVKHHLSMPNNTTKEVTDDMLSYYTARVTIPKQCPVCGSLTSIRDTDSESEILICTGANCKAKLQAKIVQMCSRDGLDITGMSEGTVKKFLDTFNIEFAWEILNTTKEDILELEGFAEKSAEKLYNAIQKAIKSQPVNKVLYAASLPLIGKTASKDICSKFSKLELPLNIDPSKKPFNKEDTIELLTQVDNIGNNIAESFYDNKKDFIYLLRIIKNVDDIKKEQVKDFNQLTFCITGQREPFKSIIENAGHKVSSSVFKKTSALINANEEMSSKATKAKDLGIPIVKTEEELKNFLENK